jgi:hypothetical protein
MPRFKQKELNGYTLRSGFEYRVGTLLNELDIPWTYEEYSYEYETTVTNGTCRDCGGSNVGRIRLYTPDFFLWGGSTILEVKGRFTGSNRRTLADLRRYQPDINLQLVFQSDNVYSKRTGRRYSDWATQYGYKSHVGLNELRGWLLDDKN